MKSIPKYPFSFAVRTASSKHNLQILCEYAQRWRLTSQKTFLQLHQMHFSKHYPQTKKVKKNKKKITKPVKKKNDSKPWVAVLIPHTMCLWQCETGTKRKRDFNVIITYWFQNSRRVQHIHDFNTRIRILKREFIQHKRKTEENMSTLQLKQGIQITLSNIWFRRRMISELNMRLSGITGMLGDWIAVRSSFSELYMKGSLNSISWNTQIQQYVIRY
jgi:hypothetical protein